MAEAREKGSGVPFRLLGVALGVVLVAEMGSVLAAFRHPLAGDFDASAIEVAYLLFSPQYLYVFEATSVLILAALVGAVALARRDPAP